MFLFYLKKLLIVLFFVNIIYGIYKISQVLKKRYKKYECVICDIVQRREGGMSGIKTYYTYCCNQEELKRKKYIIGDQEYFIMEEHEKSLLINSKVKIFISHDEEDAYDKDYIWINYTTKVLIQLCSTMFRSYIIFLVIKYLNKTFKSLN